MKTIPTIARCMVLLLLASGPLACSQRSAGHTIEMPVTVHGAHSREVRAPFQGMVTALHVAQGQTVRKGQVLMELDAAAIQMHLIQARTSLARLETQVQLCKRQNDPKAAKQAQEQYELCKEGVEKLQAGIASASIRAPADGRIEALAIDLGSRPEQDSVLCRVVEPRHFVARGIVPTSQARRIRPEDTGCLLLQDAPDPAHAARVVDIEPVPRDEETQSPDQSRVTLLVIGDDLDLQPGASGVARINGR